MTPQEAIELFKRRIRVLKQTKKPSKRSAIHAMEMAIEALEKQIPKKPKKLTYKPLIVGGWTYECPRCGCAVGENKFTDYEYIESMEPFCGQCGQAISWEGVIQNE